MPGSTVMTTHFSDIFEHSQISQPKLSNNHSGPKRVVVTKKQQILLAGFLCIITSKAYGQELNNYLPASLVGTPASVTVLSRPHPDYDASGVRVGAFTIAPQLTEAFGFDSNPRGTSGQAGSAFISSQANVSVSSNWSRNAIGASASVDDRRYLQQTSLSRTDDAFAVGGRYDVGTADHLLVSGAHLDLHNEPNGIDALSQQRPSPYQVNVGNVSYLLNLSRLSFEPFVNVSDFSYSNLNFGGSTLRNDYLDNTTVTEGVTTRYELSSSHHAVFVVRGAESLFRRTTAGLPTRDNTTISVLGGLDYVADGLWRYRVLVGYQLRQYASSAIKSQSSPIVEANVIWSPTLLTTVETTASRQILNSTDPLVPSYTDTSFKLQVEHEYLRNVFLNAHVSAELAEYQRNGGHQTLLGAGAGVTWLLNRNQKVSTIYNHTKSSSNTRTKYDEDLGLIQLSMGF
jgi:hypothetical protein